LKNESAQSRRTTFFWKERKRKERIEIKERRKGNKRKKEK
jgi:hypothetical protein